MYWYLLEGNANCERSLFTSDALRLRAAGSLRPALAG